MVGNCYFSVGYGDHHFAVPLIQTLVYVGPEEDPDDGRQLWAFRDPYYRPEPDDVDGEGAIVVFPEEQLHRIVEIEGVMARLREAAPAHPIHPAPPDPGPGSDSDLGSLEAEITRFLGPAETRSILITIRFTDDGLSLTRRPDGKVDLLLFLHPRLEPDREETVRSLCRSAGLAPSEDYLADYGRTRILAYPVSSQEAGAIAKLVGRLFLEAYALRRGDTLLYRFSPGLSAPGGLAKSGRSSAKGESGPQAQ